MVLCPGITRVWKTTSSTGLKRNFLHIFLFLCSKMILRWILECLSHKCSWRLQVLIGQQQWLKRSDIPAWLESCRPACMVERRQYPSILSFTLHPYVFPAAAVICHILLQSTQSPQGREIIQLRICRCDAKQATQPSFVKVSRTQLTQSVLWKMRQERPGWSENRGTKTTFSSVGKICHDLLLSDRRV